MRSDYIATFKAHLLMPYQRHPHLGNMDIPEIAVTFFVQFFSTVLAALALAWIYAWFKVQHIKSAINGVLRQINLICWTRTNRRPPSGVGPFEQEANRLLEELENEAKEAIQGFLKLDSRKRRRIREIVFQAKDLRNLAIKYESGSVLGNDSIKAITAIRLNLERFGAELRPEDFFPKVCASTTGSNL